MKFNFTLFAVVFIMTSAFASTFADDPEDSTENDFSYNGRIQRSDRRPKPPWCPRHCRFECKCWDYETKRAAGQIEDGPIEDDPIADDIPSERQYNWPTEKPLPPWCTKECGYDCNCKDDD